MLGAVCEHCKPRVHVQSLACAAQQQTGHSNGPDKVRVLLVCTLLNLELAASALNRTVR